MKKDILVFLACIFGFYILITFNFGCAQISAPTGGPRDSLPPRLIRATPEINTVNFKGNKITLYFNEYIDLQDLQSNLLISPVQKGTPTTVANLKSVSLKFKDTLLPNTTYSVNFGNAIKDYHEGNVLRDFTYVFSTGSTIDSLTLQGNIFLAESGKPDSTIIAMLYRNTADSAVLKKKPDYIARLNSSGHFKFKNLPKANFKLYALKDGDGGKTYNSKTELFGFMDTTVTSSLDTNSVTIFAYAEQKSTDNKTSETKTAPDKKLRYVNSLNGNAQDLLLPFDLNFSNPLKKFDSLALVLTDTNYNRIPNYTIAIDSTRRKVSLKTAWQPEAGYRYILPKDAFEDSSGNVLSRADSIRFSAKSVNDYARVVLRFTNLDLSKHPVIQFLEADNIKFSYPVTAAEWSNKLFLPGEYTIRILYDLNNNGVWDPGNYTKKIQPEKAVELPQKLSLRADWDNERDIKL